MELDQLAEATPLTVRGPRGTADLLVPAGATALDVAREYAALVGLPQAPALCTGLGVSLDPGGSVAGGSGTLLVAAGEVPVGCESSPEPEPGDGGATGAVTVGLATVLAALAVLAGWQVVGRPTDVVAGPLAIAAVACVLPLGPHASARRAAAPAFAAFAAALALAGADSVTVVTAGALVAAATAAGARVLDGSADEALRAWLAVGAVIAAVCGISAATGAPDPVLWSVLLVLGVLVARGAPALVAGVHDEAFESAGAAVLSIASAVADRGARLLASAAAAVAACVLIAAPLLLHAPVPRIDRTGAVVLVALSGAALLLTARHHRRPAPRLLMAAAGLTCWAPLLPGLLARPGPVAGLVLALVGVALAALLVAAAVVAGRGRRSPWSTRLAEIAEDLAGAGVVASAVVATGLLGTLLELPIT